MRAIPGEGEEFANEFEPLRVAPIEEVSEDEEGVEEGQQVLNSIDVDCVPLGLVAPAISLRNSLRAIDGSFVA